MNRPAAYLLSALLLALTLPAQSAVTAPPKVTIISCTVISGADQPVAKLKEADREAALGVRFTVDSDEPLKEITWRGNYGSGWLQFVDNGEFSPGVQIDRFLLLHRIKGAHGNRVLHQDYVSANVPESCAVEATVSASGATWQNPDLPAQPFSIPTIPPVDGPTVPASIDNATHDPVGLYSCAYNVENNFSVGDIRFKNLAQVAMDKIVIRAHHGDQFWDFAMFGTFSPGIFIEHNAMAKLKGSLPYYLQTLQEPSNCQTVSVHFTDGTTWESPALKESDVPSAWPTPVPNALAGGLGSRFTNTANSLAGPDDKPQP